ncbi:MAG: hypothetical protein IJU37_01525 [Desulfovibrio sp.]|nr:hypothetical protein [Desulfovibrio sp.]
MCVRFCISVIFYCLVVGCGLAGAAALNMDKPHYANQRYGFSLALPPGRWEAAESANGDGAVLRSDDWKAVVRVYGTRGYAVQGLKFDAALKQEAGMFAQIGHREVDRKGGRFSLWGRDHEGQDAFLQCFWGKDAAYIAVVTMPSGLRVPDFEQVTAWVRRSFKPGF